MALSHDGTRSLGLALRDGALCVTESLLQPGLPALATLPGQATQTALPTREGWLLLTDERALSIEAATGRIGAEVALPSGAYAWGAALTPDDGLLVLSASGGGLWCVSLQGAAKPRSFHPHRGLKRGTTLDVAVSDCGGWLASRAADDLVVTRLADGVSWPVGPLADTLLVEPADGGYILRSNLRAGFAFIGSRLLCADVAGVREVPLGEPPACARAIVSEKGRPGARVPLSVPANASLDRMLKAARLQAATLAIEAHHSPAQRRSSKPLKKNGWLLPPHAKTPPLGASRFGGWPDLPVGTDWPRWQGRPMAFLAQIELAHAHAMQPGLRLPGQGLLLFFLGCGEDSYAPEGDTRPRHMVHVMAGTEVPGGGAWSVLHADGSTPLQRQALATQPLPELFAPCSLRFAKGGKPLPDEATVAYGRLPLDEAQRDDYNELLAQLAPDGDAADQLMGHPQLLQGTPAELHCELSSRGLNPWLLPQPDDQNRDAIEAGAAEWGLLLQLTSNPDAGFMWGGGGHFYFYGRRDAMARGDFSGVWVDYEN